MPSQERVPAAKRRRKTSPLSAVPAPEPERVYADEFLRDEEIKQALTPDVIAATPVVVDDRTRLEAAAIAEMNKTHATVRVGGNVMVVAEGSDGTHDLMTFRALSDWLAYQPLLLPETDDRGKVKWKKNDRAMLWRGHPERRNVRGLRFSPGEDLGPDFYNLWKGWTIEPLDDGGAAAQPIVNHFREILCNNDERLFNWNLSWFAQMVQEPCKKPGTALVLRGEEGTGKGIILGQLMRRFMGPAFVQILHPGQVTGRFNSVWQSKLFVFADESFWAGDKPAEGILKGLITEPKLVCEFKGKEAFEIDHHARVAFASNSDWVVPAGPTARRYCVSDVSNARRGDREYFAALSACVEGDGARSFFSLLMNLDISGVNLRTPPVTEGLLTQKLMSLDSVPAWWRERLWTGYIDAEGPLDQVDHTWPATVPCARLFASYAAYCKRVNCRYPEGEENFARKLREFVKLERKRGSRDSANKRPWIYAFERDETSILAALRGNFEKWIGGALSWSGDENTHDVEDDEDYTPVASTVSINPKPSFLEGKNLKDKKQIADYQEWEANKEIDPSCPF